MKRLIGSLLLAVAVTFGSSSETQAQFTFGPLAAFHDDFDFGIGADFSMPMESIHEQVELWGSFIYFFPDFNFNFWEINGGLAYNFPTSGSITPYVAGGLIIARFSVDGADELVGFGASSTDIGLNLGGGIKTGLGDSLTGRVGARLELKDGSGFVIEAGLGFPMGG